QPLADLLPHLSRRAAIRRADEEVSVRLLDVPLLGARQPLAVWREADQTGVAGQLGNSSVLVHEIAQEEIVPAGGVALPGEGDPFRIRRHRVVPHLVSELSEIPFSKADRQKRSTRGGSPLRDQRAAIGRELGGGNLCGQLLEWALRKQPHFQNRRIDKG